MPTKLFYRDTANALSGTFPSGKQSATTPTHTASGANTLRQLSRTKGSSQVGVQITHDTNINTQYWHFYRFFCSPPLSGAQTVGGGNMTSNAADEEDAANQNHYISKLHVYVWRPSTGANIGQLVDSNQGSVATNEPTASNSEQVTHITGIGTSGISAADGDVIIVEVWSGHFVGGNRASADTFLYYDGTTENTTENAVVTSHASYIELAETLVFEGEGGGPAGLAFPFQRPNRNFIHMLVR